MVNDVLGPFFFKAKFIESSLKVNAFLFYYYISCLFSCKKTFIFHISAFEFFLVFFFQRTNNNKSDLINRSFPKPALPTTLAINAIEPTKELEHNIKLLSIHAPFILHDAMVGVFSMLQLHCESNVFVKGIYWNPSAIAIFPLLKTD